VHVKKLGRKRERERERERKSVSKNNKAKDKRMRVPKSPRHQTNDDRLLEHDACCL